MGEVFAGRYELIDMIGEGGMGAVWRVRDLRRERIIAAKVLRQSDAGSLLRFMREQGVRIHHPHVVTPLGWAGEDDKVLFTMPIVEGGSVSTLVGDYGALPAAYATELIRQMLTALAAVHDTGVVHRDIKPANLLLDATATDKPHLWLTDFGLAVAVDAPRLTSRSVVMGTPGFLAPEQLRGADPDPRSDLYAAGMVGLQMLTGHRPRPQMRSDRLDLPPRPDGTPEALWELMIRLADPDPDGRPATAHAALEVLADPSFAWVEQGEIEVFRQMPDLQGVSEGEFLRPGEESDPTGNGTDFAARTGSSTLPQTADATLRQPAVAPPTAVPMPTRAAARGATPAYAPAGTSTASPIYTGAQGPAVTPRKGGGRGPLAVLIGAPLLAALAVALLVWAPWSGGGTTDTQTPGQAVQGGTCSFRDAGTFEGDQSGKRLECVVQGDRYVWAKP
ncbi:serine/threonine-protein kinase [Luteipulveratus mongoliensis]|uniref:serine/threonine-protein kinase n=1 Tax=Luteipulveratus mongoliensis TaxID=571913 RepID=UPI0009FA5624|nr:serine/threonine-protein kinase [Luteipulveratus mongoliensis]